MQATQGVTVSLKGMEANYPYFGMLDPPFFPLSVFILSLSAFSHLSF